MSLKKRDIVRKGIILLIILYVFLLSIKLMGMSFKLFGMDFATGLFNLTSNPLAGLFVGILATSMIQSSSTTTALIVGLVAGGILDIASAIPIIMGANVGTSVTNTIVSLSHKKQDKEFKKAFSTAFVHDIFNILTLAILFPIEILFHPIEKIALFFTTMFVGTTATNFTSPLVLIITPVAKYLEVAVFAKNPFFMVAASLIVLFISLNFFVRIAKPLAKTEFKEVLNNSIFKNPRRSFIFGILLTAFVQSSSVTTSLIVPVTAVGLLTLEKVYPYILGANIGTTITALLAALATGSSFALTVALSHLIYNIFGISIFYPLRKIPINISIWFTEHAIHSRRYAIAYIIAIFYILPFIVLFLF
ncbi:MAG: Na/Pi cotransporter family protein [Candidatus Aenigmarchaeota archaeon]|nr:Na/Pi cotransporter family protein [Candidatus Aenigmarchaeota archaeon]